jgi:hypothetical protein
MRHSVTAPMPWLSGTASRAAQNAQYGGDPTICLMGRRRAELHEDAAGVLMDGALSNEYPVSDGSVVPPRP